MPGCADSPPRRPDGPNLRENDGQPDRRREMFQVLGARDDWAEPLPIIHALKQLGGVDDAFVDEATGKYVVEYDPRRTTREQIDRAVRDAGRDQGREFEPIFDDR